MALTFSINAGYTFSEVATETITGAKLNKMVSEAFVSSTSGTIETSNIGDLQVTGAKIANATITDAKMVALTLTAASIANTTITDAKMVAATLTGSSIAAGTVAESNLVANSLTGTAIANVADDNVIGGIPVIHRATITGAGDTTIALTHKTRITDVWCIKTSAVGGAGDTITVKNVATAITDAIDMNVADKILVRTGEIDDSQHEIAAGANLVITAAQVTDINCIVYVQGIRVA